MAHQLTEGAVMQLFAEGKDDIPDLTLQVLSLKPIVVPAGRAGTAPERWRMMVSDGQHFITAMLSTQLNHLIHEGGLQRMCIIKATNYTINMVGDRKVVVLLSIELLESSDNEKIGSPIACDAAENGASRSAAQAKPETASNEDNKPVVAANQTKPTINKPTNSSTSKPSVGVRPMNPSVIPIQGLSPYANKWKIKARVMQKSEIRRWTNARGEGKLFNVTLSDESGQIKATAFQEAVDALYERLVVGEVFYISRGKVTLAKKMYNTTPHDYEITFENNTEVDDCTDAGDVPVISLSRLMSLGSLGEVEKDHVCDVVAIVKDVGDLGEIVSKQTQKTTMKRDITLLDQSGFTVRMTIWGKQAEDFNVPVETVVACQGLKVGDYGGRTLSMGAGSFMAIDPQIEQAFTLKGWYETDGITGPTQTYNNLNGGTTNNAPITLETLKTIAQVKQEGLGTSEKGDYFNLRATLMFIKNDSYSYPACPLKGCNKKLSQITDDEWRCEKCDKTYPAADYRFLLHTTVNDHTGVLFMPGFNEVGEQLLKTNGNEMYQLQNDDETAFKKTFLDALCYDYDFVCRAKEEIYQDVPRIKYSILRINPVNYSQAGRELAEWILKSYPS